MKIETSWAVGGPMLNQLFWSISINYFVKQGMIKKTEVIFRARKNFEKTGFKKFASILMQIAAKLFDFDCGPGIRGRQMIKIIGSKDHCIFYFWSDFFFLDQDFDFFLSIFFALDHITTSSDLYFFLWIISPLVVIYIFSSGSYHH